MMPIRLLRRFWKDENAAVAMEAVIITPVLAWAFIGSFVVFDAFRTYNTSIKATYAVADILSRQSNTVFPADIEGYTRIFEHMVRNHGDARLRATQIFYDEANDTFCVEWSYATNGEAKLFTANLIDLEGHLPVMADAERILLVETFIPYRPAFNVGLSLMTFDNFTFTRPRNNRVSFNGEAFC
jgi:Flp pilus assembly pilin Flp